MMEVPATAFEPVHPSWPGPFAPGRAEETRRFRLAPRAARLIFRCACALLAAGGTAAAQSDPLVKEFVASVNRNITELAERSIADAGAICNRLITRAINIDAVAANALGDVAARMSSRQRADFRVAALRWAVRDCVRLNGDNNGAPLAFAGVRRPQPAVLLLATRSDQPSHTVVWRLSGSDRLKADDVIVDGRSMTLALREETHSLLDRNDNNIEMAIAILGR